MSQHARRRKRTLAVAGATVLAMALPAGDALAASYSFGTSSGQNSDGSIHNYTYAYGYGSSQDGHVPGALRLVVKRNGAVVFDRTGEHYQETYGDESYSGSDVEGDGFVPDIGDVVELSAGGTAVRSFTFSGRPTLESCPVGTTTISGKIEPGMEIGRAGAFRPGAISGDPERNNRATVATSGEAWSGALQRGLASGDIAYVSGYRSYDDSFSVSGSVSRLAGNCAPPSAPVVVTPVVTPAPQATPPFIPPLIRRLGIIRPLAKKDVKPSADGTEIDVVVGCDASNIAPCQGTTKAETLRAVAAAAAKKKAKKKKARKRKVQLASTSFSVAPGKTKTVTLKLGKSAQALLRRHRRLPVRVTVETRDSLGKVLAVRRTVVLKAPAKKKARKKSKKG